jgi:acyl-CoA synthetase (AMP-forming)/AMP-acid ligase II
MLLDMAASAFPDRVALGRLSNGITYEDLARRAAGGAGIFRAAGARTVAFVGVNGPAMPTALFAASIAGVPLAPLNYRLSPEQLVELVVELPDPVIVADKAFLPALEGARAEVLLTEDWLANAATADPAEPADVDDDATAVILFTSGTTSKPKGVVLRHANLVSYVLQTVEFASAGDDEAGLISVPPYHVAGVGTILTNTYSGRRMVYMENFTAQDWLSLVREERVTSAMVVPTMLARIVEHLGDEAAGCEALRSLAYGGARMPQPVLEKALSAFPGTGFVNAYGLTETSSTIAVLGPDDHRAALGSSEEHVRARLSSAGQFVPGIEHQIRGEEDDILGPGEIGALWVRGPQVSGEYIGSGSVLDADGWFPTRDRAYVDADGFLFIEGRADDTIIRGGENIAPAEIEDVLVQHPAVNSVAVVGVPDEEWGERTAAVVVLQPGQAAGSDELREYVRGRLRSSRTPDEVHFRDELPYTPTGKLLRRHIVADLMESNS